MTLELRLDQRQAIIRGLFGKIEVLNIKEAGIEGVGRVGMYLPDGYPYAVAEDEPDAMSESA